MRVEHKTCSTKRGASVKAIWDHNCLFGINSFPPKIQSQNCFWQISSLLSLRKTIFFLATSSRQRLKSLMVLHTTSLKGLSSCCPGFFCFQYWIFVNLLLHKMPIMIFSRHGLEFSLTINRPCFLTLLLSWVRKHNVTFPLISIWANVVILLSFEQSS